MTEQIKIKVISVEVTNRGKFDQAEVTFKNLNFDGKVDAKKLMSFTNQKVFDVIKKSQNGDQFTIDRKKDDKGYWQWVGITSDSGDASSGISAAPVTGKPASTPAPKSTYETADERAAKQVYIVRQSSISAAVTTLKTDKKNPTVQEVLDVAKQYEAYVFGLGEIAAPKNELPVFDEDEDIPM